MLREIRLLFLNDGYKGLIIHRFQFLSNTHKSDILEFEYFTNWMWRHFDYEHSPGFCRLVLIQFVYVGTYAHVPIYVTLKLPDTIQTLLGANNLMRISIVHTYDDTPTPLITEGYHISEDTPATLLRLVFACTVIGYVSVFTFFELNVVFRLTHLFKLFECIPGHNFEVFISQKYKKYLKYPVWQLISE